MLDSHATAASRMASAAARWACSAGDAQLAGFSQRLRERSRPSAVHDPSAGHLVVALGVIESLPHGHGLAISVWPAERSGAGR
jgi:hypothetical protein